MQINRPNIGHVRQTQSVSVERSPEIEYSPRQNSNHIANINRYNTSDDQLLVLANPYWYITRHQLHSSATQAKRQINSAGGSMSGSA